MRFSIITAAASLLAVAQARIEGIAVPDVIKAGEGFNVRIIGANYIQTVADVAIAIGWSQGDGFPGSLGTNLGSYYLGPEQSNVVGIIPKWVPVPPTTYRGDATISASLFSLYGASSSPVISNYNVSVTFGDYTSNNYVTSF